jgi:pimeloyl-ACP methyl ester carboxylesterase
LPEVLSDLSARHPHRSREIIELIAHARLQTRLEAFDVLTPTNPDFRQLISAIRVPTLLIIQVAQIVEAGHALHFDQPERFSAIVKDFLVAR